MSILKIDLTPWTKARKRLQHKDGLLFDDTGLILSDIFIFMPYTHGSNLLI